jgi:cation channel sperm-associated protein 2
MGDANDDIHQDDIDLYTDDITQFCDKDFKFDREDSGQPDTEMDTSTQIHGAKVAMLKSSVQEEYGSLLSLRNDHRQCSQAQVFQNALNTADGDTIRVISGATNKGPEMGADSMNTYTSTDLEMHPQLMHNLLRERSSVPIAFASFQRDGGHLSSQPVHMAKVDIDDPRVTRTTNKYKPRLAIWARWLSNHSYFRGFIVALILLSSIILAIQVELPEDHWYAHRLLGYFDTFILLVFICECGLKWMDSFHRYWYDSWNCFDFFITALSLLPEIIFLFQGDEVDNQSWLPKLARQLRVLRALRSFKMISKFGALKVLIQTVLQTFSSIWNIMLLLGIMMYIFAIMGVTIFEPYRGGHGSEDNVYFQKFGRLDYACVSLFQMLTFDQWYKIYQELKVSAPEGLVTIFSVSWVWIGGFVFRNIFVGVMVRGFDQATQEKSSGSEDLTELDSKPMEFDAIRSDMKILHDNAIENIRNRWVSGDTFSETELSTIRYSLARAGMRPSEPSQGCSSEDFTVLSLFVDQSRQHERFGDVLWPRDALDTYLKDMIALQENIKEYEELQKLATNVLIGMTVYGHDIQT